MSQEVHVDLETGIVNEDDLNEWFNEKIQLYTINNPLLFLWVEGEQTSNNPSVKIAPAGINLDNHVIAGRDLSPINILTDNDPDVMLDKINEVITTHINLARTGN